LYLEITPIKELIMDVMCLGILVADIVSKPVNSLPDKGTLALLDSLELHTGGCAANTGCGLAKLGVSTGIMGMVGPDFFGDFIISRMKEHGIDVRGIQRDKTVNTSATQVMVDAEGERTFLHHIGANGRLNKDTIDLDLIRESKILHIAGTFLLPGFDGEQTVEILKAAKDMKKITSLDTVWDASNRWAEVIKPYFKYVDIFLPNIDEARNITGKKDVREIADEILASGVRIVGIKQGPEGCYIKTEKDEMTIPAFKVDVVDGTGAGDAFVAGFLTGILKKWDMEKTGLLANAAGGLCASAMGATSGLRDLEGTLEFIREQGRTI
jgi:sugar/nucleoside kinase (ribokinase family)